MMVPSSIGRIRRAALLVAVFACLAVVACACGSGGASAPRYSGPAYGVDTGTVSGLGTVLVDGQGFTLYLYEPDAQSGTSHCSGPCAVEWSPFTLPSGVVRPVAGPGIDAAKVATTKRSDGTVQVTYNGWPLYTWAQDMAPGQATGEGLDNLGGLWFVVDTAGSAVKKIGSGSV
jgi:predicted lipoprotein with Yx(FWY)xxD motif